MQPVFKYSVNELVRFGSTPYDWKISSRHMAENADEPQYYLQSQTTPSYFQWVLESDLREASDA